MTQKPADQKNRHQSAKSADKITIIARHRVQRIGDYYMEGRSVSGQWFGEGARKLGSSGVTSEKEFVDLCRNLHPQSGEQLTPRLNSKRVNTDKDGNVRESANRRVFYDFTLPPPKSVSIAALVGNDKRIIEAHDEAVQIAMRELQIYAAISEPHRVHYGQKPA